MRKRESSKECFPDKEYFSGKECFSDKPYHKDCFSVKEFGIWNNKITGDKAINRWGRKQDQQAFEFLNIELKKYGTSLDQFLSETKSKDVAKKNKTILSDFQTRILNQVGKQFGWHKSLHGLYQRLQSKAQKQEFSFREFKLLKRVVKQMRKAQNYDINELSFLLPGKLHGTIRDA